MAATLINEILPSDSGDYLIQFVKQNQLDLISSIM